jgi:hypothetical protein
VAYWVLAPLPPTSDAQNYWMLDLDHPYDEPWGAPGSFVYSPPIALLLAPLTELPFPVFYKLLMAANLTAMVWLVGGVGAALALLLPPVQAELTTGNVHLLLAVCVVLGFRASPAWAGPILTKVTPVIGLLWFVARREWRAFGAAAVFTGGVILVTVILVPGLWADWVSMASGSVTVVIENYTVTQVPVFVRAPIAAGLVVIAAWRDLRWVVPIAIVLGLPAIWLGSLCMLLAVFPLLSKAPTVRVESVREGHSPAKPVDTG